MFPVACVERYHEVLPKSKVFSLELLGHFIMQRYIPQRGINSSILRVVMNQPEGQRVQLFKFYALTSKIRIDGKSPDKKDKWLKLTDIT